jgi:flavin reductase
MSVGSTPFLVLTRAEAAGDATLRRTFGRFATGVTVMTVGGPEPHGMTANSFTSVSLRPPLVLVCVDQQAIMHERMVVGRFGISVLSEHQENLARHFADLRRPLGAAQFDGVDNEPGRLTGAPLLRGAVAHFECELSHAVDAGDHTVFIARLLALGRAPESETDEGLVFVGGRFRRIAL